MHVAGEDRVIDSSDDSSSHNSLSMGSSSGPSKTCYSEGTLIQTWDLEWIKVEHLKPYDYVLGQDRLLRVMFVEPIQGSQTMMEVCAGDTKVVTTSTHRFMVMRGGRPESAPASSLRPGDDVQYLRSSDHGNIAPETVTRIELFRDDCVVYRVVFFQMNLFPQSALTPS